MTRLRVEATLAALFAAAADVSHAVGVAPFGLKVAEAFARSRS